MKKTLSIVCFTISFLGLNSQTIRVPASLDQWDTVGANPTLETYLGKQCIAFNSGAIILKNADLKDGTVEADVSFPRQRAFPGFVTRMQADKNFEFFYLRPHQSGNPDATQYTPVFNGQAGWQLYHGDGYTNAFPFRFDQWHHIKIELHGLQAEFYIDDTLVIKVKELLNGWKSGKIGVVSEGIPLRIANVQYNVKQGTSPTPMPVPANGTGGVITQWQVSNVITRRVLEKQYKIPEQAKKSLVWSTRNSEPSGTINLARFGVLADSMNTMIAKTIIESTMDQVKELSFGFSDFVTIYLNGKALYSGSDNFLSRDYRFLGTIGYFDKLFLPLKKGVNELWFVVSENFGGWGVKAKFDNMKGITLK